MTQQTIGKENAQEFYILWERLTNSMGSEYMTPFLVKLMDREHPTLRQQMVAMMISVLNGLDTAHAPDDRDAASCAFLAELQQWLRDYRDSPPNLVSDGRYITPLYLDQGGQVKFPFI